MTLEFEIDDGFDSQHYVEARSTEKLPEWRFRQEISEEIWRLLKKEKESSRELRRLYGLLAEADRRFDAMMRFTMLMSGHPGKDPKPETPRGEGA